MPQNIDSNFDALVSVYADTEVERLQSCDMLRQFAYDTLIKEYGEMTEQELIEYVAEALPCALTSLRWKRCGDSSLACRYADRKCNLGPH